MIDSVIAFGSTVRVGYYLCDKEPEPNSEYCWEVIDIYLTESGVPQITATNVLSKAVDVVYSIQIIVDGLSSYRFSIYQGEFSLNEARYAYIKKERLIGSGLVASDGTCVFETYDELIKYREIIEKNFTFDILGAEHV